MITDPPTTPAVDTLPRGRHGLPPEVVADSQRERLVGALVDRVAAQGYAQTTVAQIVTGARVSRETFYSLFRDKADCYAHAARVRGVAHLDDVIDELAGGLDPLEGLELVLRTWFARIAADPKAAQCFLLERPGRPGAVIVQDAIRHDHTVRALLRMLGSDDVHAVDALLRAITGSVTSHVALGQTDRLPSLAPSFAALVACHSV